MDKKFLEDAIPMEDFNDTGLGLVNITNQVFIKTYKSNEDRRIAVNHLILNLYDGYKQGRFKYLSKDKNKYRKIKRYGTLGAQVFLGELNRLVDQGYIEEHKGFFDKKTHLGKVTRICATPTLEALFTQFPIHLAKTSKPESIILKTSDKRYEDYTDTTLTNGMRGNLEKYFEYIHGQDIRLVFPTSQTGELSGSDWSAVYELTCCSPLQMYSCTAEQQYENSWYENCTDSKDPDYKYEYWFGDIRYGDFLYRVFNDGSFNKGGRFYGATYQNIPRSLRSRIMMNKLETVELDYQGMCVNQVYAENGLSLDKDPYVYPDGDPKRDDMKRVFHIMLNTDSQSAAVKAVRKRFGIHPVKAQQFVSQMMDYHSPIASNFYAEAGKSLMNQESNIIEEVLVELVDLDIPALPIHDCVIVPEINNQRVESVMQKIYKKHTGQDIIVKQKM